MTLPSSGARDAGAMLGHVGEMLSGDVLGADTGLDLTPTCHLSPNDVLVLALSTGVGLRRHGPTEHATPTLTEVHAPEKIKPDWASRRAA